MRALLLVCLLSLCAPRAMAASLCGTVRDGATNAPVSGAAVFLFDDAGQSTGRNTGTAADGTWCLHDVAAGTYTILVERDDYQVARVDGVVVQDTVTNVPIEASMGIALGRAVPNPASSRLSFRWRVPDGAPFTLEIFDLRGRRVKAWSGRGGDTDGSLVWNLRGADGRPLPASAYFAVLRSAGERRVERIAVIR